MRLLTSLLILSALFLSSATISSIPLTKKSAPPLATDTSSQSISSYWTVPVSVGTQGTYQFALSLSSNQTVINNYCPYLQSFSCNSGLGCTETFSTSNMGYYYNFQYAYDQVIYTNLELNIDGYTAVWPNNAPIPYLESCSFSSLALEYPVNEVVGVFGLGIGTLEANLGTTDQFAILSDGDGGFELVTGSFYPNGWAWSFQTNNNWMTSVHCVGVLSCDISPYWMLWDLNFQGIGLPGTSYQTAITDLASQGCNCTGQGTYNGWSICKITNMTAVQALNLFIYVSGDALIPISMPWYSYIGNSSGIYYTYLQQVTAPPGNSSTINVENANGYPVSIIFGEQAFHYWYPVFSYSNGTMITYWLQSEQIPSKTWQVISGFILACIIAPIICCIVCGCVFCKKRKPQPVVTLTAEPYMSLQPNANYQPPTYYNQQFPQQPQYNYPPQNYQQPYQVPNTTPYNNNNPYAQLNQVPQNQYNQVHVQENLGVQIAANPYAQPNPYAPQDIANVPNPYAQPMNPYANNQEFAKNY